VPELLSGKLVSQVPRIERSRGFEEQDVDLFVRDWAMLDAPRDYYQFILREVDRPVAELHAKSPLDHQEQLVLLLVVMPYKLALELDQLDMLAVQFGQDDWRPIIVDLGEFGGKRDLLHIRPWLRI
jgi:hypothetical protein